MITKLQRNLPFITAGSLLIIIGILSFLSEGYFGGADNICHFHIARYAFRHHELFLNAWGRPLYTMLGAPFAHFGLQALKFMNVLLGVATGWLAWRICRRMKLEPSWPVMLFVIFTPLYFMMVPTAMTEILFSFLLVLAVFLMAEKRFVAAAVVISFLPFARTEGYVLLAVFSFVLLAYRQFKAVLFLAAGIVIFSIAGSFHFRDIFWLINQFPYPVTYHHPIYNKTGSLLHFFDARDYMLGLPLEILFVFGLAGIVRDFFSKEPETRKNAAFFALVIFLPFAAYFALHSLLYWRAMGGSLGLERVMAAVLPLAAIIAFKGLIDYINLFKNFNRLKAGMMVVALGFVTITPFTIYRIPYPLTPEEETAKRAAEWLRSSPYGGKFFLFTDNNLPYYLKADPYKTDQPECKLFGDSKYLDTIRPGTILVWDAHFGANESKIPLDSLLGNRNQRVVAYFRPDSTWITFGGGKYDCYITVAMNPGEHADNYAISDSLKEQLDMAGFDTSLYLNTFENPGDAWNGSFCTYDTVHRGKTAFRMDYRTEYSPGFCQEAAKISSLNKRKELLVSACVYIPGTSKEPNTLLVVSFEHGGKSYHYSSLSLNDSVYRPGRWHRMALKVKVPGILSPKDLVKVYIWNPGKQRFYIDDIHVYASGRKK